MTSPTIDWADIARRAEEKHRSDTAKLQNQALRESLLKTEATEFMKPFEDLITEISNAGFVNNLGLVCEKEGYETGYKLHVVLTSMKQSQTDLEKVTNPDEGLMNNALSINCMSGSIHVNVVCSEPNGIKQLNDRSLESAKACLIEWIMERHPALLVEVAKRQIAKPPQARL